MTVGDLISELEKYPKDMLVCGGYSVISQVECIKLYIDHRGDLACYKGPYDNVELINVVRIT